MTDTTITDETPDDVTAEDLAAWEHRVAELKPRHLQLTAELAAVEKELDELCVDTPAAYVEMRRLRLERLIAAQADAVTLLMDQVRDTLAEMRTLTDPAEVERHVAFDK